jgi:hypothetical protein
MISNAGDFSELQLVAPDLQREPNEGLCGTKNVFEKLTVFELTQILVSLSRGFCRAAGSKWLLLD